MLTFWVARTLFKNGQVFLDEIFEGNKELATSVNKLLVVGFYLLNIGFVVFNLTVTEEIETNRVLIEVMSLKMGFVILVLGGMHFLNLIIFSAMRKTGKRAKMRPPVAAPQYRQPPQHMGGPYTNNG